MPHNDSSFWKYKVHADTRGNSSWQGCRRRRLLAIWVATSSETSEIRPAILYDDMLPLVGLWLIAKWMT